MRRAFAIAVLSFALISCTRHEIVEYVIAVESVSVEPSQLELSIGDWQTLTATVFPTGATNRNVTWSSDKPQIVSVDERGRVHALAVGEALVTVTTEDGSKTAACRVLVRNDVPFFVSVSGFPGFSNEVGVPFDNVFDNVRAEISGFDWEIITTLSTPATDRNVTLTLPEDLPGDKLCKVARDSYSDYAGFWPAEHVSDKAAKVAKLDDIVACNGDTAVGRLYLTSWNGEDPAAKSGAYFAYFHYADRPFTLSGNNLTHPSSDPSYIYDASFKTGWNIYFNIYKDGMILTTTDIPDDIALKWHFEPW